MRLRSVACLLLQAIAIKCTLNGFDRQFNKRLERTAHQLAS